MSATPVVQFGTSRFLQAHVDLFVSEALARGEALGPITTVQTTASAESARRVAALATGRPFPVLVRGLEDGARVERAVAVASVRRAFVLAQAWPAVEDIVVHEARAIVSNTGDRGFDVHPADRQPADGQGNAVPRSFPAKLLKLLHARYRGGARPLDLYPCELVSRNGDVLRDLVAGLARDRGMATGFQTWLVERCRWVNALVDRIVSAPLEPVGAVAEPYALWAIEDQPGLEPICRHPQVTLTDDLARFERLKLLILNLGHTWLAGNWLAAGGPPGLTVREALADPRTLADLHSLYDAEVLPVFAALGMGEEAARYRAVTIERLRNPCLDHKLADIAKDHGAKKQRRFGYLTALAERHAPALPQPRLRAALA